MCQQPRTTRLTVAEQRDPRTGRGRTDHRQTTADEGQAGVIGSRRATRCGKRRAAGGWDALQAKLAHHDVQLREHQRKGQTLGVRGGVRDRHRFKRGDGWPGLAPTELQPGVCPAPDASSVLVQHADQAKATYEPGPEPALPGRPARLEKKQVARPAPRQPGTPAARTPCKPRRGP
jgi:hypothetical protein